MNMKGTSAVTVKDAMRLTQYSLRQIDRFIKEGVLELVDHQPHQPRKVSQASLDAFLLARGIRPVDEVNHLKQATGDALLQVAALRAQVEDLERWVKKMFAELEAKLRAQVDQSPRRSTPAGPEGAIMLVRFAEAHAVSIGILRGLAERDPTLATVIKRPYAEHKKQKWMIMPTQMAPMLAAVKQHGTPYAPCMHCPHTQEEVHLSLAQ